MARNLTTKSIGPLRTAATVFERGKERPIEITLHPTHVTIRAIGTKARYNVPYGSILTHGAQAEVKHRIRRGAV